MFLKRRRSHRPAKASSGGRSLLVPHGERTWFEARTRIMHPDHRTRIICEAISPYRLDPRGKAPRQATKALLVGRFLVAHRRSPDEGEQLQIIAAHRLSVFWFQCGRVVVVGHNHFLRATTIRTDARLHNNVQAHGTSPVVPPPPQRQAPACRPLPETLPMSIPWNASCGWPPRAEHKKMMLPDRLRDLSANDRTKCHRTGVCSAVPSERAYTGTVSSLLTGHRLDCVLSITARRPANFSY